jgi:ferredoxin/flavodoxin---NADP+ reductase
MSYKIVNKRQLNKLTFAMQIEAKDIVTNAQAGHFVMIRIHQQGERIPLTIADALENYIEIIFKVVGDTTHKLSELEVGDHIYEIIGPLGHPFAMPKIQSLCVIAGGVGCAIGYPIAKEYSQRGVDVTFIAGFKDESEIFYEDEFHEVCNQCIIAVEQQSEKYVQGNVVEALNNVLMTRKIDALFAIGSLPMMKAVTKVGEQHQILTVVSLNPIMVDGIGMCGGCRVNVDGKAHFACVDGPEFDGRLVDFDTLIARNKAYDLNGDKYAK